MKNIPENSNIHSEENPIPPRFQPMKRPLAFSPCLCIPHRSKFPKKALESCKWPFKNDSRDSTKTAKRNLKDLMDAECERCSFCVRKCEVIECPLWQYRTKACKVHRGYLERLRKTESLSDEELDEIQKLYEDEDEAMRRVFDQVQKYCPSRLRTFIRAYSGKSRASAVKAYEVYMANYDLTMVESMEGGSL